MPNPRLAARYAKSLFDLVVEKNTLDETLNDMQLLSRICHQNHDFVNMLRSPIINTDKKHQILLLILEGKINVITQAFVNLLATKGRESYLPEIADAFVTQYKELKKIKTLRLTTAVAVNDNVKEAIRSKVAGSMTGNSIELETETDPALIGGFVLEMDDKLFDASIRRELHEIKSSFMDNDYVSNIR